MTENNERLERKADSAAQKVARVYAEALLEEAQERGMAEEILDELRTLLGNVAGVDPLIGNFFLGGLIGRHIREEILRKAFEGRASDLFVDFLLVVNHHDRLDLLRPITEAYQGLLEQRMGKVRVSVRSAVPLDEDHRERLTQQLRQMMNREPVLEIRVVPELIGGLMIQVGDWLYDASVRSRLEALQNQLIQRSSHVIKAG
jgi:F-type H+-transporting ATPase subunit delta